jgi:hypothetical protein
LDPRGGRRWKRSRARRYKEQEKEEDKEEEAPAAHCILWPRPPNVGVGDLKQRRHGGGEEDDPFSVAVAIKRKKRKKGRRKNARHLPLVAAPRPKHVLATSQQQFEKASLIVCFYKSTF